MKARILFVELELSYEPQGVMSLSAYLKQAGHDVALTVASLEDPVATALQYKPDILGFSVMTGSQKSYLELNRRMRAAFDPVRAAAGLSPVFSVFGGPHPTFFPDMIAEAGVDGVCVGQGEGALLELADEIGKVREGAGAPPTNIANWWFSTDGGVVRNPVRPLIRELAVLPDPDRALIYDKHRGLAESKIKHFITSRGCPYDCTYCFNHAYYEIYQGERRGHQLPVQDVIRQVNQVRSRWPLEQVVFVDDLFILRSDWLEEFADRWPQEVGLPFFCNVRADILVKDPRRVNLLKRAGCFTVSMGIESANDHLRTELLKRRITRDQIVEAGRLVRAAGMQLTTTNILALPTSTLEDDLATMRLNTEAHVSYAHAFLFQPYPGTELGRFTQEQGLLQGTFEDIGEVAWGHSVLAFEEDDKRQREHLQRLFAIGVEWPGLEPFIRKLIRLPRYKVTDMLMWWVLKFYRGIAIYRRVHPVKLGPRELVKSAMQFMWIRS